MKEGGKKMRMKFQSVFVCVMLIACAFTLMTPTNVNAPAGADNHCWWSDKGDNLTNTLKLPLLNFTGLSVVTLVFWHQYDIQGWDAGYIEVSSDGGKTWKLLEGYTGSLPNWNKEELDLSSWAGTIVFLRFFYLTTLSQHGEGWYVDDVSIPEIGFFEDTESGVPPGWEVNGWSIVNKPGPSVIEWVPFIPGASPGAPCEVLSKSRDTMGLCVDSTFHGMYTIDTSINGTLYHYLHVPNAGHATELGKPTVPVVTRFFEIPHDVDVSVSLLHMEEQVLDGYNVIPAQEQPEEFPNATLPPFTLDTTTYATDAFFPSLPYSIVGQDGLHPIIIRGVRVVALSLYPVRPNPVVTQVKVHSKIEVRIDYDGPAQVGEIPARLKSPAFENLYQGLVANYNYHTDLPFFPDEYTSGTGGAEYLIITHDDFEDEIEPLADWKDKKGILTKVVNTTEIDPAGPDAGDITDYIRNAYNTWDPAPSYILLVGDSDHIPPHYEHPHPSDSHGGFNIPTDLYYVTVDGDDYFPDIYLGRLSVDTPAQTTTIVDKILMYERDPPDDPDFYNQITAVALFEDEDDWVGAPWNMWLHQRDGFEDKRFVLTSEEIRDHLHDNESYTVDRVYWARNPAGQNPTNYNNGPHWFFDNGAPLPEDLEFANFSWNGNAADITTNITEGRFLIYHRDHGLSRNFWHHDDSWWGWSDGWGDPPYDTGNIAGLANGDLLPVVFSVECQCGWFDGEVDQNDDPALTRNFESFCEEFVRHAGGGAIAAIGSTRNSRSGYNDELAKGFIDAIWPDFDDDFASGGMYSLGQVLTYGKIYTAGAYGYNDDDVNLTFQLFHLFGDPEMEIWTAQPEEMDVEYPDTIGSEGSQKFAVTVKDQAGDPIHFARVCLRKQNDIYNVKYTNPGGTVIFDITPASGGSMNITVTKHNYIPHEGDIAVTSDGATLTVDPDFGPSGITTSLDGDDFTSGETVDITFPGTPPTTTSVVATGGSFHLDLVVPAGDEGYANVLAVGQTSGRTAVAPFRRLPDTPLPDLYTYSQWDSSTWHLNSGGGDPIWNSPCIQLYDAAHDPVSSHDLTAGRLYTIEATFYNDEPTAAVDADVTFAWNLYGAGQGSGTWNLIVPSPVTITVPAASGTTSGTAIAEIPWTPGGAGHVCLKATIYHPWDPNPDNDVGQENTHVKPVSSPGVTDFLVTNPTTERALVYLEARQIDAKPVWPAYLTRAYPQELDPGETKTATLTVDVPPWVTTGETRTFEVTAYIDGEIIGGINVDIIKDRPPVLLEPSVSPTLGFAGTVFTFTVVYMDADDHPPLQGHPKLFLLKGGVHLTGNPFSMNETDPSDTNYKDGKLYTYSLALSEPGDDYSFYFGARDILGVVADETAINVSVLMVSPVDVEIKPETLNLNSKGRWITCKMEVAGNYSADDIVIDTVLLEDSIPAEWGSLNGKTAMIKFDRSEVEDMLSPGNYNLKVTGELTDGTMFECYSNEIRVIKPP